MSEKGPDKGPRIKTGTRTTSPKVLYVGSIMAFGSVTSCWNLTIAALTSSEYWLRIITYPPY